jgi:hypothetical protein
MLSPKNQGSMPHPCPACFFFSKAPERVLTVQGIHASSLPGVLLPHILDFSLARCGSTVSSAEHLCILAFPYRSSAHEMASVYHITS